MLPFNDTFSNTLFFALLALLAYDILLIINVRDLARRYTSLLEQKRQEEVG